MNRFSATYCVNNRNGDVINFVNDYLAPSEKLLFIGTVGIDANSIYYPSLLAKAPNATFKFFIEKRPDVHPDLLELGELHRTELARLIPNNIEFAEVDIIALDGATVAGRNATKAAEPWFKESYKDVVVDTTGMSRGTCFPLVRQALELGKQSGANVHLLIAADDNPKIKLMAESNGRADWMHGFQEAMGTDHMSDALTLWVPQLTENSSVQMSVMFSALMPLAEVCPIVPFPSTKPRRGDELLLEYFDDFETEWDASAQNVIYAHESDPLDVYRSICRMQTARSKVFPESKQSVTVLSPAGWRIGSLGMLLAALDLKLPVQYVETVGYTTESSISKTVAISTPSTQWHIWLAGSAYEPLA
jgi:hypothetical protein